MGLKRRGVLNRWGWRLVWEEGGLIFTRIKRKTLVLRPALASVESKLLVWPYRSRDKWGGEPNSQIISIKRAADGRRQRRREFIDEKREEHRAKNGSLQNTSTYLKEATFVILINHASAPIRTKRLSPTSKARREASRNKFVENSGLPDKVKSF